MSDFEDDTESLSDISEFSFVDDSDSDSSDESSYETTDSDSDSEEEEEDEEEEEEIPLDSDENVENVENVYSLPDIREIFVEYLPSPAEKKETEDLLLRKIDEFGRTHGRTKISKTTENPELIQFRQNFIDLEKLKELLNSEEIPLDNRVVEKLKDLFAGDGISSGEMLVGLYLYVNRSLFRLYELLRGHEIDRRLVPELSLLYNRLIGLLKMSYVPDSNLFHGNQLTIYEALDVGGVVDREVVESIEGMVDTVVKFARAYNQKGRIIDGKFKPYLEKRGKGKKIQFIQNTRRIPPPDGFFVYAISEPATDLPKPAAGMEGVYEELLSENVDPRIRPALTAAYEDGNAVRVVFLQTLNNSLKDLAEFKPLVGEEQELYDTVGLLTESPLIEATDNDLQELITKISNYQKSGKLLKRIGTYQRGSKSQSEPVEEPVEIPEGLDIDEIISLNKKWYENYLEKRELLGNRKKIMKNEDYSEVEEEGKSILEQAYELQRDYGLKPLQTLQEKREKYEMLAKNREEPVIIPEYKEYESVYDNAPLTVETAVRLLKSTPRYFEQIIEQQDGGPQETREFMEFTIESFIQSFGEAHETVALKILEGCRSKYEPLDTAENRLSFLMHLSMILALIDQGGLGKDNPAVRQRLYNDLYMVYDFEPWKLVYEVYNMHKENVAKINQIFHLYAKNFLERISKAVFQRLYPQIRVKGVDRGLPVTDIKISDFFTLECKGDLCRKRNNEYLEVPQENDEESVQQPQESNERYLDVLRQLQDSDDDTEDDAEDEKGAEETEYDTEESVQPQPRETDVAVTKLSNFFTPVCNGIPGREWNQTFSSGVCLELLQQLQENQEDIQQQESEVSDAMGSLLPGREYDISPFREYLRLYNVDAVVTLDKRVETSGIMSVINSETSSVPEEATQVELPPFLSYVLERLGVDLFTNINSKVSRQTRCRFCNTVLRDKYVSTLGMNDAVISYCNTSCVFKGSLYDEDSYESLTRMFPVREEEYAEDTDQKTEEEDSDAE